MLKSILRKRKLIYMFVGFIVGLGAPALWAVINLVVFRDPSLRASEQVVHDIIRSPYNSALYLYMGLGTSLVMAIFGYFVSKVGISLQVRADELERLNHEVGSQKEEFEKRYKILDENIKNFQKISNRIQKSMDISEVLSLCAEGLHDILGYERVNILMIDPRKNSLYFAIATGSEDFDVSGVSLPLDNRIGVIYKCLSEKRRYLVDDIAKCPADYFLKPPFDGIKPLRSRSFVLCPIVVKGEAIGLFGIDNKLSRRMSNESDVDTINLFADQVASAIMRINLLKAINALTSELETTFSTILQKKDIYTTNVNNLKMSVESVFTGTEKIATSSEVIMSSVDETSSAVSEISVAIDQVTKNMDFLAESIDKSLSAMEEMHASIKNVEKNAAVSHEVSSEVKTRADKGMSEVEETIASLADIQHSVELSYNTIKHLTENSGRIGNIVKVIKDITKRTNLLALNASIIAAQAGEYGKNFGVVADEIRNLSFQTSQSTGEITGIIEDILNESQKAAENVAFSKELVQKGVDAGRAMGESLGEILGRAVHSMEMTEEIRDATEEQVQGVKLVNRSIEDVSAMTSQIFNASKEQSNATKNILKHIQSIDNMTQAMTKATAAQVRDGAEIEKSVVSHVAMIEVIFDIMEKRQQESSAVMRELELMKGIS
jgi:methyl-accepting chemotaxis protein